MFESDVFTEESKKGWITNTGSSPTDTQLILGCLQRIASSLEVIQTNYVSLLDDINFYKERCDKLSITINKLNKQNAGLRGYIKRRKKISYDSCLEM